MTYATRALTVVPLIAAFALPSTALATSPAEALKAQTIRFSGLEWAVDDPEAALVDRGGVEVLSMGSGSAWLTGEELSTGVIEVDVWPGGGPGFTGIGFHSRDLANLELVYLRIHKSGSWDAVQYCPRFNSIDGWQLYTGPPFTAAASWTVDEPVQLRLEVGQRMVRVFVGSDPSEPLLTAPLKTNATEGGIMLWSRIGSQFSNFRFKERSFDEASWHEESLIEHSPSAGGGWLPLRRWEISESIDAATLPSTPHRLNELPEVAKWLAVETEPDGLLNLSRWRTKSELGRRPINNSVDAVFARTRFEDASGGRRALRLDYSDSVLVFLNGEAAFAGSSAFRSRHPSYLGLATGNDVIYLDLLKGENELVIVTSELFGGWGFRAELESAGDR